MGSKLLTEKNYFDKNAEFRVWYVRFYPLLFSTLIVLISWYRLQEKRGKYFDELSQSKTKKYFKKFVKAWNTGALAGKIASHQLLFDSLMYSR